jgi:glyoxylase-like metal-dependent hydrolase (beta-lactamase superfamily II)
MQSTFPGSSQSSDKAPETAREVREHIWKFLLPIPFPLRDVNMYALVGPDGWALVDAGMGTPDARAAFSAGLERSGLQIERLQAIVLTHNHPDHVGLSGELQEQSGAKVYIHPLDEPGLQRMWSGNVPRHFDKISSFFGQHGLPFAPNWYSGVKPNSMRNIIRVPEHDVFTFMEDGQELELAGERYRVVWVPGHSDGLISLYRERDGVFLASDHILPRITPNIGLYSEKERPDPLNDYLNSLAKVKDLSASIVLPGHGDPLFNLQGRIAEIIEHHEQRLAQILSLLKVKPQHAYQLTEQLFGDRLKNDEARRMATAEVVAHLEYLRLRDRIQREQNSDDILLYIVPAYA